jgi:hypothetical protein
MATQATTPGVSPVTAKAQETTEITALDREVGAAFIASGIGTFVLGLAVIVTEMKAGVGIKNALNFLNPVGPLSGKTTVSVIAFIVGWVALHFAFKNRGIKLTTSFAITIVLIVLGLLMTFPPFFDLFAQ